MTVFTHDNTVGCGLRARIFLDGEEMRDVIEADIRGGRVVTLRRGDDGKIILDGEDVATRTVNGAVVVELRKMA